MSRDAGGEVDFLLKEAQILHDLVGETVPSKLLVRHTRKACEIKKLKQGAQDRARKVRFENKASELTGPVLRRDDTALGKPSVVVQSTPKRRFALDLGARLALRET